MGGIDLLINNAGALTVGPYSEMTEEDFEAQMELHFYAVMSAVNLALPYLRQSPGRRIVNICSMGGRVAVPHMLPYDVSKFALSGYSQGITSELAAEGISVTTVYPALLRTGSAIQAVFKGDHEKEFAWFAAADALPGLSADPTAVARKILRSALSRETELTPSFPGRFRNFAASLFPEIVAAVMKGIAVLMPTGSSKEPKTGAQSRALLDESPLGEFLLSTTLQAETDFNQRPKADARFNMGLPER
jgi:short-subunit dehydrogenase